MEALGEVNVEMFFNTSCNKRGKEIMKVALGLFKTDKGKSFFMP